MITQNTDKDSVKIVTTARALIVNADRLLLVQNKNDDFWYTPGGWMDGFETLHECCRREVHEELGLEIEPIRLVYISEVMQPAEENEFGENLHKIEHYFYCKIISGKVDESTEINAWQDEDNGLVTGVRYFTKQEISDSTILPVWLKSRDYLYDISHGVCEYVL